MTPATAAEERGRTDWARIEALSDGEIDAAIAADPDAPPSLDAEWYSRATQLVAGTVPEPKRAVSIRLDQSVVDWFKAQGPRYQSRINAVLRAYVATLNRR